MQDWSDRNVKAFLFCLKIAAETWHIIDQRWSNTYFEVSYMEDKKIMTKEEKQERRTRMINDVINLKREDPALACWQIAEMLGLPESTVRHIIANNM